MTKVLTVAPIIRPGGGPGGYAFNLQNGLKRLDAEEKEPFIFDFMGPRDGRAAPAAQGRRYKLKAYLKMAVELGGLKPLANMLRGWTSASEKALRNAIDESGISIFHGPFFLHHMRYAAQKGKRVIYMPHSPSIFADEYAMTFKHNGMAMPKRYRDWRADEERQCITCADHVVFPSRNAADNYFEAFDELEKKSIFYIPSGVDVENQPSRPRSKGPVRFLFAGRYVAHKGYDLFCTAAEILSDRGLNAQFITAGTGPLRSESDAVIDLGWRSDIFALLGEIDIVVIPNRIAYYDLFPLECAAMGKPLVMTAVGGSIDQLAALPDTVSCREPTAEALALSMEAAHMTLLANIGWGAQNKQIAAEHFTSETMARSWIANLRASGVPLK